MATAPSLPFVSAEEYLNSSYHPDIEYVDGTLVERHVGERKHSRLQGLLFSFLQSNEAEYSTITYVEQRIRVGASRWRIPDVCAMASDHIKENVFTQAPLIIIEVLSRKDQMGDILDKCDDYRTLGVTNIVVADPERRRVFAVTRNGRVVESESLLVSLPVREDKSLLSVDFEHWFSQLD